MNRLESILQIKQFGDEEVAYLRFRLTWIYAFMIGVLAVFLLLWLFFLRQSIPSISIIATGLVILAYGVGLWIVRRGWIWQSITWVLFWVTVLGTIALFDAPQYKSLIVLVVTVNLVFVSICSSKRLVQFFFVLGFLSITLLNLWPLNKFAGLGAFDWVSLASYLSIIALIGLCYFVLILNMELSQNRGKALANSEKRYRLLFEAAPVALWELNGNVIMMHLRRLAEAGIQDFDAYFQENPEVLKQILSEVEVLNVNETAVSVYKGKNKSALMGNLNEFLGEEAYTTVSNSIKAFSNGEPIFESESKAINVEGEEIEVLYRAAISEAKMDSVFPFYVSAVDITRRRQVEEALKTFSNKLQGLHELDLAINVKKTPEEVSEVALNFIAQFVISWGADVWAYSEKQQTVTLLARIQEGQLIERPFLDPIHPAASLLSEELWDDLRNNQPFIINDLFEMRYMLPELMTLKNMGVRSFIQMPLLLRGQLIGFLNIYDTHKEYFSTEQIGYVQEFAAPLAIALGNIQLFVAESVARNQAERLRRVATRLSENLEVAPLLENILADLEEVVPFDSASIFLAQDKDLSIVAHRGLPEDVDLKEIVVNGDLGAHSVYAKGKLEIIPDTRKHPEWVIVPKLEYIRSWMGVPLQGKGKTIGVLSLDRSIAQFYDETQQELAIAFANQAAIAIENARLYEESLQYAEELERRVAEQTRDLSALYEITSIANRLIEIGKFFDESLQLLVETLECDFGTIHVIDHSDNFILTGQYGLPDDFRQIISFLEPDHEFVSYLRITEGPIIIPDLAKTTFNRYLKLQSQNYSFAGVVIQVKDEVFGILSVLHDSGKQFSTEDVALLSSVADHFGVTIEINRLRQQNQEVAVLQERERLARELHDSVTQSLYSLTLFAEASKELSQSGENDALQEYLDDISLTAQQALKEMRLMLYELRTSALVEEGLVNALRFRLEAVEGRSGIDANLDADENISIPPELGRALYLIAQEALNNMLRHAKATAVFVTLKNSGSHLVMTIQDDGRGFTPETAVSGGMGLETMRQRIESIGGRFLINSLVDIGTKIELSIDLEKYGGN